MKKFNPELNVISIWSFAMGKVSSRIYLKKMSLLLHLRNSLNSPRVTCNEVAMLAIESKHFSPIWKRINSEFGSNQAMKIVDKIQTSARIYRHNLGQT